MEAPDALMHVAGFSRDRSRWYLNQGVYIDDESLPDDAEGRLDVVRIAYNRMVLVVREFEKRLARAARLGLIHHPKCHAGSGTIDDLRKVMPPKKFSEFDSSRQCGCPEGQGWPVKFHLENR